MENKNWLKEHIVELLAIIGVVQNVFIMLLVLFKMVRASDSTTLMILTSSNGICLAVLMFYFGSSKGSKDKQTQLDEIQKTNAG